MQTFNEALEGFDFEAEIEDDELIADAVVLLRLVNADDGSESVFIAASTHCGGITQVGMLASALAIVNDSSNYEG